MLHSFRSAAPYDAVYDVYDFRAILMLLMLKCLVIVIGAMRCGRHDDRGIVIVVNG